MNATAPAVAPLDFAVASQFSSRPSFDLPAVQLGASSLSQQSPVQIPAVGYATGFLLEVDIAGSGGTTPAWQADGPWNVIESITLRNAAGVNLITPMTGFQLFLLNLLGGQTHFGAAADPRAGINAPGSYAASTKLFLWVPIVIDPAEGYGAIPALASNTNYQIAVTYAAQSTVTTSDPTLTVTLSATVYYFDQPDAVTETGVAQQTKPPGMPAQSIWNIETPVVSPGSQYIKSSNTGNLIRNHIFVLRNSSGARIDTNGWPALFEVYINNNPRFSFGKEEFEFMMQRWYGLLASSKETTNGLLTGVYSIPWHALLGSQSGDPANTRAQLLPTLSETQLQFRGQEWGSAVSRLEIITESVSTTNAAYALSK